MYFAYMDISEQDQWLLNSNATQKNYTMSRDNESDFYFLKCFDKTNVIRSSPLPWKLPLTNHN